jgi:hypothetical protein
MELKWTETKRPLLAGTGEHCPRTGLWTASSGDCLFLGEGSLIPSVAGKPAIWQLYSVPALGPRRSLSSPEPLCGLAPRSA